MLVLCISVKTVASEIPFTADTFKGHKCRTIIALFIRKVLVWFSHLHQSCSMTGRWQHFKEVVDNCFVNLVSQVCIPIQRSTGAGPFEICLRLLVVFELVLFLGDSQQSGIDLFGCKFRVLSVLIFEILCTGSQMD